MRQDDELGPNQAEIMALPRPEHHAMLAQPHWFRVRVDRDMPDRQQTHSALRCDDASAIVT